ncbi:hypothetical protein CDCA_CDCA08G2463 [Cyanidium caldarium]|uniref:Uncharacterized protein n=1 Tax=Cyanidium caldarium TaxID=2771 RepID=A0AAV9IWI1_CYACA|nr:hypothetical protein CDCA_CDCA08G2463 [Cyanidium caldarium]
MALNVPLDVTGLRPAAFLQEVFICERAGLRLTLHPYPTSSSSSASWRKWLTGESDTAPRSRPFLVIPHALAILSTVRLVLIATQSNRSHSVEALHGALAPGRITDARGRSVHSLEIPLHTVHREAFDQPFFGASRLHACAAAFEDETALPRQFQFACAFEHGGFGTFVPLTIAAVTRVRRALRDPDALRRLTGTAGNSSAAAAAAASQLARQSATEWVRQAAAVMDPADPTRLILVEPDAGHDTAATATTTTMNRRVHVREYLESGGGSASSDTR